MNRQIVLDTETTGLNYSEGHKIIEIGCVELINRKITSNTFHYYINPERSIDQSSINITGITEDFLQDKPLFSDIREEFIAFVDSSDLIIHNARFDLGFLNNEFNLINKDFSCVTKKCKVIDTLLLARKKHPGQKNSLDALCGRYQLNNFDREKHGALLDATILAYVYLALTGGQSQLFSKTNKTKKQTLNPNINNKKCKKILVSKNELISHKEYLEYMKEYSGKDPLWEI
jgi:DNA polymerase-3 subunit epsilon